MNLSAFTFNLYTVLEPLLTKEITGPRSRYSAAHDHFSNKTIDPLVLTIFLSVIVLLLLTMILQHHKHMKQIHKHNEELLKHHKAQQDKTTPTE